RAEIDDVEHEGRLAESRRCNRTDRGANGADHTRNDPVRAGHLFSGSRNDGGKRRGLSKNFSCTGCSHVGRASSAECIPLTHMPANFLKIRSSDVLDELFERSKAEPVVLFKHSSRSGISAHLKAIIGVIDAHIHYVAAQEGRVHSDRIAERTGYRHHTPQIFVIKDGEPAYHATHYGIDPSRVAAAARGE